jgi:hypothetical protein
MKININYWATSYATSTLWPFGSVWMVHSIERECQMAAHREAISVCQCHMTISYWPTSAMWAPPLHWPDMWVPPTCHVAGPSRATSAPSATWQCSNNKWQLVIGTTKQCKPIGDTWHSLANATSALIKHYNMQLTEQLTRWHYQIVPIRLLGLSRPLINS